MISLYKWLYRFKIGCRTFPYSTSPLPPFYDFLAQFPLPRPGCQPRGLAQSLLTLSIRKPACAKVAIAVRRAVIAIRTAGPAIRTIVPVAAEENLLQFQLRELVCASRPVPKHFGWIAPSIYENRHRSSRQTGCVTRTALRADVRQRFSRSFYDALRSSESPRAPRLPPRSAGQTSQAAQRDPQYAPSPQAPPKRTRRKRP